MTDGDILSTAMWLYDGRVPLGIRIRYQSVRHGSGDWADDPEVRDDIEAPAYVLEYEAAGSNGGIWNGGGQFSSLIEAKDHASLAAGGPLHWNP